MDSTLIIENRQVGTTNWLSTKLAPASQLAVWAAPYDVAAGDTLKVYVHSQAGAVSLRLFRLGWYGGRGATQKWASGWITAGPQSSCTPAFPGPVTCPWAATLRIAVPANWRSGIYLLKVTDSTGASAAYPFVIKSLLPADFVAVVPQFTWQAYNDFGGSSLYVKDPATTNSLVHFVSFERPYRDRGGATYIYGTGYSNDISVVQWLERHGYDVAYVSDLDLALPSSPPVSPRRGLVFIGHDEYWTWKEYDRVRALRNSGVSLIFMSANNAFWNIRLSAGETGRPNDVITCYKSDHDPDGGSAPTSLMRYLGRTQTALYGTFTRTHTGAVPYTLMASDTLVGPEAREFLRSAGVATGDTIGRFHSLEGQRPTAGSFEGDVVTSASDTPTNLQIVARAEYPASPNLPPPAEFQTTFYVASSGAGVFAVGNTEWGRLLGNFFLPSDPRVEALTKRVFDWVENH